MEDINVNAIADTLNHKVDLPAGKNQSDIDYVVAFQRPTADNNYTWYRLYKSGWVEQGGIITFGTIDASAASETSTTLPVAMADMNYKIIQTPNSPADFSRLIGNAKTPNSTTVITLGIRNVVSTSVSDVKLDWQVSGMAAE